jgi:hypothetical protein
VGVRGRILGALGRSLTLRGDSLEKDRADLAWLAKEQPALRRVATLVARGSPADELFAAVTRRSGGCFRSIARMRRYDDDGSVIFLAGWSGTGDPFPADPRFVLGGENLSTLAGRTAVRPGSTVMPKSPVRSLSPPATRASAPGSGPRSSPRTVCGA